MGGWLVANHSWLNYRLNGEREGGREDEVRLEEL